MLKERLVVALAHITGGGLLENIPRVLTRDLAVQVDCGAWKLPPVFEWLRQVGNLGGQEMARTFNCGVGLVLIVASENSEKVLEMLEKMRL